MRSDERDTTTDWRARRRNGGIDWPSVEKDYRAGALSLREMAGKHGCSHSAIANFASRNGWSRDRADRPVELRDWPTSRMRAESTDFMPEEVARVVNPPRLDSWPFGHLTSEAPD